MQQKSSSEENAGIGNTGHDWVINNRNFWRTIKVINCEIHITL